MEPRCHIHCRESAIKRRAAEILRQQQRLAEELQRLHEEEQQLVVESEKETATEDVAKQVGPTQPADFQVQREEARASACHSLAVLMMGFRQSQFQKAPIPCYSLLQKHLVFLCCGSAACDFVLSRMWPGHHFWSNETPVKGCCSSGEAKPQGWLPALHCGGYIEAAPCCALQDAPESYSDLPEPVRDLFREASRAAAGQGKQAPDGDPAVPEPVRALFREAGVEGTVPLGKGWAAPQVTPCSLCGPRLQQNPI